VALLDPEVVFRGDGGGKVAAWPYPVHGADKVARRLLMYLSLPHRGMRFAEVGGGPGIVMRDAFGVLTVIAFTVDAGRIVAIDSVRNPDKLVGVNL
jgi:RNA polymerase sigma-70 factor (ECF subfamily)